MQWLTSRNLTTSSVAIILGKARGSALIHVHEKAAARLSSGPTPMGMQEQLSVRRVTVTAASFPSVCEQQKLGGSRGACLWAVRAVRLSAFQHIMHATWLRRHHVGTMGAVHCRQQSLHRLAAVLAPRAVSHGIGDVQLGGCVMGRRLARSSDWTAASAQRARVHLGPSEDRDHAVRLQTSLL